MTNIDCFTELHPIGKIEVFQKLKSVVFQKMEQKMITPQYSDEILDVVQKTLPSVHSSSDVRPYIHVLTTKFPELAPLEIQVQKEDEEALEIVLSQLLEYILEKDFDLAAQILLEIETMKQQNPKEKNKTFRHLQEEYPKQMQLSLEEVQQRGQLQRI
ncbi:hypothetical protein K9M59_01410 [Candidatus Gracilibacteria bacterium]|nr:hypothetical protein [Candidatus Gracilibacteria bacterium]MCF7819808.1 hypothetical protein [Candidatus Gracilibacteria bacterium]